MGDGGAESASILKGIAWCRQVDNEAESPRHQPSPAEGFTGYQDCLPRLRIVGDLAINLSDTSDYWDPDPRKRISFYRNLFLYTAGKGRYLCLGRMFLSTEDRPRLGIKTLVLGLKELLATGQPVALLRKWYAEMASEVPGSSDGARPSPALLAELARSMVYEKGDAENPVMVALTREWPNSAEAIFTLLERSPSTLLGLSGVLVFPYYIPAGNVDYSMMTRAFPLSLAVFRMDSNMTVDQRKRRLDVWAKKGVTLVDLTSAPLKEPKRLSQPIQWMVDERESQRQDRLRTLVDESELRKILTGNMDGDDGPYHRRELSRIYTTMETLATTDKEFTKPARRGASPAPMPPPPDAPSELSFGPPWTEKAEVVRVERVGMVAGPSAPAKPAPASVPSIPPLGPTSSAPHISKDEMLRYVDSRIAEEVARLISSTRGPEIERLNQEFEALRSEVREMDERVKYFAERTLPVLKKTWTRIESIDKVKAGTSSSRGSKDSSKEIAKLKEEVWQELHRMETDLAERSRHILERMESNLQNQGRIWLTLVQEISRLTRERHAQRIEEER